jgi:hypothetical protein
MVLLSTNVHNDVLHLLSLPDAWNELVWHDTHVLCEISRKNHVS